MSTIVAHLQRQPLGRRAAPAAAVALLAVSIVHLVDGPASLDGHLYIGALELALAAATVPLAIMLLVRPLRDLWLAAATLNVVALALFVASRTVGLPGSSDDIGNWGQLLGVINVAAELGTVAIAAWVLAPRPR